MVCIPLGELVGKVNIQVRPDEVVIFDCEPADIKRWLLKILGFKTYVHVDRVEYDGFDVISWLAENYGADWAMLAEPYRLRVQPAWWRTTNGVYMREDIYTHWSLAT